MINKLVLGLAAVLFVQVSPVQNARAQSLDKKNAVFVDAGIGTFAVKNSFTREFTPSPAFRLGLRFPFLTGQLEGGVRFLGFNGHANTEVNSDFHSFFIYAGYYYPFRITDWYAIGPALRVGYNLIYYEQTKVYTSGSFRYETDPVDGEFSYELALRNQFKVSGHWFLHASIFYNHTYTKIPLPLTMISLGFSYAFSEPGWLKTFLR
jgi:hypothetical protein